MDSPVGVSEIKRSGSEVVVAVESVEMSAVGRYGTDGDRESIKDSIVNEEVESEPSESLCVSDRGIGKNPARVDDGSNMDDAVNPEETAGTEEAPYRPDA
jgi:hypothetical protein